MKIIPAYISVVLTLLVAGVFPQAQGAVDHVTAERGSVFEYLQMQDILDTTSYPVKRSELVKRLGGKKRLRQYSSMTEIKGGVRKFIIDYALTDNDSDVGFFLIEFLLSGEPKNDGTDEVLSAQYYFQSARGVRFIPEPAKGERPANKPPLQTPAGGTPAAGAPVAPPSGAAGR